MPPVPAHAHSWRGIRIVVDLQASGPGRLRVPSHSNEYMGMLRAKVAKAMGCSPAHVRLFCSGTWPPCSEG